MNMKNTAINLGVLIVLLVVFGGAWYLAHRAAAPADTNTIATISYLCDGGKTITATYYRGETKPAPSPDQPPVPGGSIALSLNGGPTMTLPQTISADGARYANADESFVFWSKGTSAFIMENGATTYTNCAQQ
jgi:membrane-bound inhibitor of C-type lysozyme